MVNHRTGRWRRFWLRPMAVLLGVMPLVVCECLLRLFDLPSRPAAIDPYVDLHHLKPLFTLDATGTRYKIGARAFSFFSSRRISQKQIVKYDARFCTWRIDDSR